MTKPLCPGLCVCLTIFGISIVYAVPSGPLYINDTNGNLGTVNLSNGSVAVLGNSGTTMTDIAFTSDGNLYGTTFGTLYSINKSTGAASPVFNYPAGGIGSIDALLGGGAGTLYAASNDTDTLYTISLSPFAVTPYTGSAGGHAAGDLAFAPSGGQIYETLDSGDLARLTPSGNAIASTIVGNTGLFDVYGLATGDDGITYAVAGTKIYTINLSTAALTLLLDYSGHGLGDAYGLAFSNESVPRNALTIASFAPVSGKPGTVVTINGTNFTGATSVKFNGVAAASFTVVSAAKITATVPPGATIGTITVTTPVATATSAASFKVIVPVPTISVLSPSSAKIGTLVTIAGANFTGATTIRFSNNVVASFTVLSDTKLTTTVPVGTVTGPVTVVTPSGAGISQINFTLVPSPPVITNFSPTVGKAGSVVTVAGSNLTGLSSVTLNGVIATFTLVNASKFTFTVPAGASTGKIAATTPVSTVTTGSLFAVKP